MNQKIIAKHAGVSASLVSRILSGKLENAISVSEEKLVRIRCLAENSEYGTMERFAETAR